MEVRLSAEGERIVRRLVEDGRYASPLAAIEAGVRLLETREAACPIRRAVALGLEQALAGRSVVVTPDDLVRRAARRVGRP